MRDRSRSVMPGETCAPNVKMGNTGQCLKALSAAIAKRAYEISQLRGRRPGGDRENWILAEKEILQPLGCYGTLDAKDEAVVSMFCSALGAKDIEEIEVCTEPHRLIFVGEKGPSSGSDRTRIYRVLQLTDEFDPSSVSLRQQGPLLEIQLHKVVKRSRIESRAA